MLISALWKARLLTWAWKTKAALLFGFVVPIVFGLCLFYVLARETWRFADEALSKRWRAMR